MFVGIHPLSRVRFSAWLASLIAGGMAMGQSSAPAAFASNAPRPRAEVISVYDPAAVRHFLPNPAVVRGMVERGLLALAGKATATEAWQALLRTNDVVGFKVNSAPGDISGTRPIVVRALIESLLAAGHSPRRIIIWDKRSSDLRQARWYALADELGVRCVASEDAGWDPDASKSYEKAVLGRLTAGDLEFSRKDELTAGRRSYVTSLLTRELTAVIPVTPVLTHNLAGVNGQLTGLAFAAVDNTLRFANNAALLAEAIPEICALDDVLPRVVFGVSDALIAQYRGEESVRLHNTVVLNEIRFSRDPVALDALALDNLERARQASASGISKPGTVEVYVNAELLELGISDLKRIDVRRVN